MALALQRGMKKISALPLVLASFVSVGFLVPTGTLSAAILSAAPTVQGDTADEQSQAKPDLALLQRIRQAIVKDKTLSVDGHNCKVITKDGLVRLRGPVDSEDEKARIGSIATKVAGKDKVTNELTIKPATSSHFEER